MMRLTLKGTVLFHGQQKHGLGKTCLENSSVTPTL